MQWRELLNYLHCRWAETEINPMHVDVIKIQLDIQRFEEKYGRWDISNLPGSKLLFVVSSNFGKMRLVLGNCIAQCMVRMSSDGSRYHRRQRRGTERTFLTSK